MEDDSSGISTQAQSYAGPERRRINRTVAGRRVIGHAWLRPGRGRSSLALDPGVEYPILERRPTALLALEDGLPEPGYVWLEAQGKAHHIWAGSLEIREDKNG